ncbi:MAG: hypothetical protein KJ556_20560, partial [Gammaproteobacteria bacterium]|nr:hypothetical protein [Gammaproteobacteria bacterium]
LTPFKRWEVLGNHQYGVCVAVTWANMRRLVTGTLTQEIYPNLKNVIDLYKTQNPFFPVQDMGMDIQLMLNHVRKNGDPLGTKPVAFAKLNVRNLEEIKAAIYIFGGIVLGMAVQAGTMNDFYEQKPLDYHPINEGNITGLHAILAGGYMGESRDDVRIVTWGRECTLTQICWEKLVANQYGEAWCVIWEESLGTEQFVQGIDLAALAKAFKALTNTELPITIPPPILTPKRKVDILWDAHKELHK